jgi:hypothetical protein
MNHRACRLAFVVGLALARRAGAATEAAPEEGDAASAPRAVQSISFASLPPRTYRDPDFEVTASASSGLPVSFTASGDCAVAGSTVRLLSAGKCWVTAHQPGDGSFLAAPDVDQRFTIGKARQRITGNVPAQKRYLDPDFPLDLAASSGLPVVFMASGSCAMDGPYVHILSAGTCSLTAHQPGDANFTAARIRDRQFEIARADQTILFGALPGIFYGTGDASLVAEATSGLPVRFTAAGMCAPAGAVLHILGPGTCTVAAEQDGNGNFNPAPAVTQTIQVLPAN